MIVKSECWEDRSNRLQLQQRMGIETRSCCEQKAQLIRQVTHHVIKDNDGQHEVGFRGGGVMCPTPSFDSLQHRYVYSLARRRRCMERVHQGPDCTSWTLVIPH